MSKKRVLITGINGQDGSYLTELLLQKGYEVYGTYDGDEGLKQIQKISPDLILLDVDMPKKNGLEVYKALFTANGQSRVPVLVLTGHAEYQRMFAEIEADGFVSKPFEMKGLLAQIQRVLEAKERVRVFLFDNKKNPAAVRVLESLSRERYKTAFVQNLKEFEEMSVKGAPDFVLVEYLREDANGDEFIQELVRIGKHAAPIVAYSNSGLDYKDKCLKAGADVYIDKPSNPQAFLRAFRTPDASSYLRLR